nr:MULTISPECIES: hypothetical protein [Providencia]
MTDKAEVKELMLADISFRDYLAAEAMNGILTNPAIIDTMTSSTLEWVAGSAYDVADAMLNARGWYMDIEINCRQVKTLEVMRINGETNRRIRLVDIKTKTNSWEVDGYLIAAAPELLSELIRLRNIVASYKQDSGDNLDITDAVIAKALGQQ